MAALRTHAFLIWQAYSSFTSRFASAVGNVAGSVGRIGAKAGPIRVSPVVSSEVLPHPNLKHPRPRPTARILTRPPPQVYQRDELKLLTESGPVSVFADRRSTTADLKSAAAAQLSISPRLALMLTPPDSTAALGDSALISRYTTAQGGGPLTLSATPRPLSDFAAGGARRGVDAVRVQPVGASGGRAGAALVLRGVNGGTTVAQIKQARSGTWTELARKVARGILTHAHTRLAGPRGVRPAPPRHARVRPATPLLLAGLHLAGRPPRPQGAPRRRRNYGPSHV